MVSLVLIAAMPVLTLAGYFLPTVPVPPQGASFGAIVVAPHIRPLYAPIGSDVPEALAAELRERLEKLFSQGVPSEIPPLPRALMPAARPR